MFFYVVQNHPEYDPCLHNLLQIFGTKNPIFEVVQKKILIYFCTSWRKYCSFGEKAMWY